MSRHFTQIFSNLTFSKSTYGINIQRKFHLFRNNKRSQLKIQTSSTSFRCLHEDLGFISKHYRPKPGEVLEFLNRNYKFPKPTESKDILLVKCPKCRPKKINYTLKIDIHFGTYKCTNCMHQGLWCDYVHSITKTSEFQILDTSQLGFKVESEFSKSEEEIENFPNNLHNDQEIIGEFVNKHGIMKDTLVEYQVGIGEFESDIPNPETPSQLIKCITFPRMAPKFSNEPCDTLSSKITRIKACKANPLDSPELVTYDPAEFVPGLFGYHLAKLEDNAIIITRNEYDAMAAYQETKIPAVCLPTQVNQLHSQVLPLLERFSKIYVWLDDDVNGQDCAEKFVQKLGIDRCVIVNTKCNSYNGPINAYEALKQGRDLNELLELAKPLQHEQILNFDGLKDAVYREITNPNQVRGVLSRELPGLNKIMKGHRLGELTVFTGPTGTGKTTILSQISLDYCKSGVSTLWGSFEISNVRLAKKMLTQFAGKDLSKHPNEFHIWAKQFQQLPMYFLKFFGSTEIKGVIEAMEHAIHAFDVQHIIIDNLQFMTSDLGRHHLDKFEIQDRVVSAFRKLATEKHVHISVVVHPRKESRELLDINSVFGTGKITQEADNVVIIQKVEEYKELPREYKELPREYKELPRVYSEPPQIVIPIEQQQLISMS
ncbi:6746_t:CDS:2 [Diversispora eburnea]|uniref:6746_t:CDS:1 n=1 Tax=Diversispora eburnea TaxID=1213867 RepID=A0A9N8VJT6_9GLOM|nr:6746_t:CDS:2 [Diversispora eburnea]